MNWKKVIGITAATLGTAFVATSIVAKLKKGDSTYENDLEQKNPLEGKKVVFVENEEEPENADGVRGHLEAVGDVDAMHRSLVVVLAFAHRAHPKVSGWNDSHFGHSLCRSGGYAKRSGGNKRYAVFHCQDE